MDQRKIVSNLKKSPDVHRPGPSAKQLGRPRNEDVEQRAAVVRLHKEGVGILKRARQIGVGTSYVQRILAEGPNNEMWMIASYLIEVEISASSKRNKDDAATRVCRRNLTFR